MFILKSCITSVSREILAPEIERGKQGETLLLGTTPWEKKHLKQESSLNIKKKSFAMSKVREVEKPVNTNRCTPKDFIYNLIASRLRPNVNISHRINVLKHTFLKK